MYSSGSWKNWEQLEQNEKQEAHFSQKIIKGLEASRGHALGLCVNRFLQIDWTPATGQTLVRHRNE